MLLQQKESLITLLSGLVFAVLMPLITPMFEARRNEAILAALVLFILTLWIGRLVIGARFKALDERDKTIRYQAAMIAIHFFGAVVMIFACVLYLLHYRSGQVPLHQVLTLAYYGWISLYVCWAGSMLILHRTGTINV